MIKHKHIPIASRVFYQAILDEIKIIDNQINWAKKVDALNDAYIKKIQYSNSLKQLKELYDENDE